jgi:vacuolar-type H+-ATPase subunit H
MATNRFPASSVSDAIRSLGGDPTPVQPVATGDATPPVAPESPVLQPSGPQAGRTQFYRVTPPRAGAGSEETDGVVPVPLAPVPVHQMIPSPAPAGTAPVAAAAPFASSGPTQPAVPTSTAQPGGHAPAVPSPANAYGGRSGPSRVTTHSVESTLASLGLTRGAPVPTRAEAAPESTREPEPQLERPRATVPPPPRFQMPTPAVAPVPPAPVAARAPREPPATVIDEPAVAFVPAATTLTPTAPPVDPGTPPAPPIPPVSSFEAATSAIDEPAGSPVTEARWADPQASVASAFEPASMFEPTPPVVEPEAAASPEFDDARPHAPAFSSAPPPVAPAAASLDTAAAPEPAPDLIRRADVAGMLDPARAPQPSTDGDPDPVLAPETMTEPMPTDLDETIVDEPFIEETSSWVDATPDAAPPPLRELRPEAPASFSATPESLAAATAPATTPAPALTPGPPAAPQPAAVAEPLTDPREMLRASTQRAVERLVRPQPEPVWEPEPEPVSVNYAAGHRPSIAELTRQVERAVLGAQRAEIYSREVEQKAREVAASILGDAVSEAQRTIDLTAAEGESLLAAAAAESDRRIADGELEADKLVSEAQSHAEKLLSDAQAHSEKLGSDSLSLAGKLVADARAQADKLISDGHTERDATIARGESQARSIIAHAQVELGRRVRRIVELTDGITDIAEQTSAQLAANQLTGPHLAQFITALTTATERAIEHVEQSDQAPEAVGPVHDNDLAQTIKDEND